jgi:hypothetical protein
MRVATASLCQESSKVQQESLEIFTAIILTIRNILKLVSEAIVHFSFLPLILQELVRGLIIIHSVPFSAPLRYKLLYIVARYACRVVKALSVMYLGY